MVTHPTTDVEEHYWRNGQTTAGIDEAGRGALAGPVVAAAVILNPTAIPEGIRDSKQLPASKRHGLALAIQQSAVAWAIGEADVAEIERFNILQATFLAMHRAVEALPVAPSALLVDGNRYPPSLTPVRCIVGGDRYCLSIAAASILAKHHRDTWMTTTAHTLYPNYHFDVHKGYGTLKHRQAIVSIGPCEIHRPTFLRRIMERRPDSRV
jgi:ribonuclease HII